VPERLPNFVIVGAMKSGTTSLAQYIGAHPDGFVVPKKELYFFERSDLWEQGADWYRSQFAAAGDERAVGEASPSYMYYERAIERMAGLLPEARLIAMLRDPVERAYSHYLHWRFDKVLEQRSFGQAVREELEAGPTTLARHRGSTDVDFSYVGRGVYLPQLENICEHFPRESLMVVLLEDLERAPVETFAQVCRFLGIDAAVVPENVGTVANAHHVFRPVWLWRLSLRYDLWRFVPKRYRMPLLHRMGQERTPEPIEPAAREQLTEYYGEHNAALAQWLGRDLSAWDSARSPARA
jgi:Sulfotransferase domain